MVASHIRSAAISVLQSFMWASVALMFWLGNDGGRVGETSSFPLAMSMPPNPMLSF